MNYEVPDDAQQYVHRIGRTGRAGRSGIAVTLVDWRDITRWNVINKALGLDFADPVETYSTSPHLMEQLQIPEGTKGRLAASRKTADADNRAERPRRHKSQRHAGKDDKKSDRPRRKRIRRRDGKVVERSDRQPPDALPESTA